jgi:CubicO group peptidase (beta-lactamase class C family)
MSSEGLDGLDELMGQALRDWKTPGLALAVVQDGAVIVSRGYGVRDLARGQPVTPDTLFAIGSATKAFTTMALGMLVDDGKLNWDTPLREYLPDFRLKDPFASERMTPRDLVCHRSGLPRHDLVWYGSPATRRELVERLRYLEPNKDFRTTWQYQNLMYLTAGYLVGVVAGTTWEEFVQERIIAPLGMRASNFSVHASQQAPDCALPYMEKQDEVFPIPFRDITTIGPAGSINATLTDMTRWLLLHLNRGKVGETQLIAESTLAQMHAEQMAMQEPLMRFEDVLPMGYGLGWFREAYRGRLLIHHGGNIDGFSALVSFLPRERAGVVALSNLNGTVAPTVITYSIYDRLLGLGALPWSERARKVVDETKAALAKSKELSAAGKKEAAPPSHPLADYAGEYAHPAYGTLAITVEGEQLSASLHALPLAMAHYHYDIFELADETFELRTKASFATDLNGAIASVSAQLEPAVAPIVFTRVPDKAMRDPAFLARFVGRYELPSIAGRVLAITLKGDDTLVASLAGQPDYELVPYEGTTFNLKGLPGFSITFTLDASGAVAEAVVSQPGVALAAKKIA